MRLLLTLIACLVLGLMLLPASAGEPHLTTTTGKVVDVTLNSDLITVNTRMGPKTLTVNDSTLVFLNNRVTSQQTLTVGDQVELDYRFDTAVVFNIRIFREATRRGVVVAATPSSVTLRLQGGGRVTFTTDAQTNVHAADVVLGDQQALVGLTGKAIYQPGTTPLLLRFFGDGSVFKGQVTSIDSANSTLVVTGPKARTFTLVDFGTVRVNGVNTTLDALSVGDSVRVAFDKQAKAFTAYAVVATN